MKRSLLLPFTLFFSVLFSLFSSQLYATHAQGVDISYTWISGTTYRFTLNFYRDCAGVAAPAGATLSYLSPTSCGAPGSITLTLQGAGTEVSPLCPAQLPNSTCNGGALPGVEQYIYEGTVTFPAQCPDWTISWDHCCRNAAITNLNNPSGQSMYIEATLNNTGSINNNSPTFTSLPVPYICANQQFCYNHGAVDPDGDSLAYSLVNALTTGGANIPYNAPYTPTYPITDISSSIIFDPVSGSMCVTPPGPQTCVITIQVDEYRNGVLIGTTMRDLQIIVQNCSNVQPVNSSGGVTSVTGGTAIDTSTVSVCPNTTVTFDVQFGDSNPADIITATSNLSTAIPGATINFTGTNPVTASFSWTPGLGDVGTHPFNIIVQDNGCPILGSQVFSFTIIVLQPTTAGPDRAFCGVGPVQLNATGGTSFTWSVISGDAGSLSCTNCPNPQVSPGVPTVYEVVSNLTGTCPNRDTVFVDIVPGFSLNMPNDTSICRNGAVFLTATPSPAGTYTYNWTPTVALTNPNTANPIASPDVTTKYYLEITSGAGCRITDSVTVTISGVAPLVTASPDVAICPGTATPLSVTLSQECGPAAYACSAAQVTSELGSGASFASNYGPIRLDGSGRSNRSQYILTRADLNAAGWVTGGRIDQIAVNVGTAGTPVPDLTIKMGCTSLAQFPNGTYLTGLTTVRSAGLYTPTPGWDLVTLTTPFYWDGTSNLVVEYCTDAQTIGTSTTVQYTCNLGNFQTITTALASTGACSAVTGSRLACKPNIRLVHCEAEPAGLTYNWAPGGSLDNSSSPTPNATPTTSTSYLVGVSDGLCTGNDIVTVSIDSTNWVDVLASNLTPCSGDTVALLGDVNGPPVPITLPCGINGTTCSGTVHSENVGNGFSSSEDYGPFYATFANERYSNRVQYIFTAAELQAAGVSFSGTIQDISLNLNSIEDDWNYLEIKMGCVGQSEYSTNNFITGLSTVYLNTSTYNNTSGWNTWVLQSPFDWDGTSNIAVEFCTRVRGGGTRPDNVTYGSTSPNFRTLVRNELCNCLACGLATGTRSVFRPNVIFTICDAPLSTFSYTWSPTTFLSSTNTQGTDAETVTNAITYTLEVAGGKCTVTDTVSLTMCAPLNSDNLRLRGEQAGADALLNWESDEESFAHYYQVFHSADGENYALVGSTESARKQYGTAKYSLMHQQPPSGMNYYRVKKVNLDGTSVQTDPVSVEISLPEGLVRYYPNPVQHTLHLEYMQPTAGDLDITITDIMGRQVGASHLIMQSGRNDFQLDMNGMPAGTYFVRLQSATRTEVCKIVHTK